MNFSSVDVIWTLLGAALVYFMQAGFAMCEAGLTRAKNTGNILMKNMMDFCIGTPAFWLVGFGLMFGVFLTQASFCHLQILRRLPVQTWQADR